MNNMNIEKDRNRTRIIPLFQGVFLCLLLCCVALAIAGCGKEEPETEPAEPTGETLQVITYQGSIGSAVVASMKDGDPAMGESTAKTLSKLEKTIKKGDYDVAILPTATALALYADGVDSFVEISPTAMGGVWLLSNDYQLLENSSLANMAPYTVYLPGADSTEAALYAYLMGQTGVGSDSYVSKDLSGHGGLGRALGEYSHFAVVAEPYATALMKENEDILQAMNVEERWADETDQDLPTEVMIAKKDLAEDRPADLQAWISAYDKANQDRGEDHAVFYGSTNRGITILKAFNETIVSGSTRLLGGRSLPAKMYYQGF